MPRLLRCAISAFATGLAAQYLSTCAGAKARAAEPLAYCRQAGTDDSLRPIPGTLVAAARSRFGLANMPDAAIARTTVFRCFDGGVLLCNTGANLPCGKANVSSYLPAASAWCAKHPDSPFIPMYITGHDTIYRWRCAGAQADAGRPIDGVDARGFIAKFWRRLD